MSSTKPGFTVIRKVAERGPERSKLYEYLVKHYRRFSRATQAQKRVPWVELADLFSAEIDEPVTEVMARHTWTRVKQAVARKKAIKAEIAATRGRSVKAEMPSRFPTNWRPPEQTPAPPPSSPKPVGPSGPASPTDGPPVQSRADVQIARLKRHFAERDGRKPPSS